MFTLLDLCVSSLRRGHANLLCIVPILTDDPRRESNYTKITVCLRLSVEVAKLAPRRHVAAVCPCANHCCVFACMCPCSDCAQDMAQQMTRNGLASSASRAQVLLQCGGHPTHRFAKALHHYSRWNVHFSSIIDSQTPNAVVPVLIGLRGD